MTADDVRALFDYNDWANGRLVEVLQTLDDETLRRPIVSSFPSLLATWGHMVGAEWVWLQRFRGTSPTAFPKWLEEPSLDDLNRRWEEVKTERRDLLSSLADDDLEHTLDYRNLGGKSFSNRLLDLCLHVTHHASYHRGQLTTMLRQVGAEPVSVDYVQYCRRGTHRARRRPWDFGIEPFAACAA